MDSASSPTLAVVVPVYNEEANIETVYREWARTLDRLCVDYRFIFVDDGSKDRTDLILAAIAESDPVRVVHIAQANSGHGRACRRGYEEALALGAPWILQIDSDGQCDPAFLNQFWIQMENADCLFGQRTSRGDGPARLFISRICSTLVAAFAGQPLGDVNVPYRLMRAEALARALDKVPRDMDLQNIGLAFALGSLPDLRWKRIPIHFRARAAGENSINLPKIARMGLRMLLELRKVRR